MGGLHPVQQDDQGQFEWYAKQEDRFTLGVCNGCQLMSQINYVPFPLPDRAKQPRFIQNRAGKLECRVVNVRIEKSQSVLLRGMEGSTLGVWIAHGEGRCLLAGRGGGRRRRSGRAAWR